MTEVPEIQFLMRPLFLLADSCLLAVFSLSLFSVCCWKEVEGGRGKKGGREERTENAHSPPSYKGTRPLGLGPHPYELI